MGGRIHGFLGGALFTSALVYYTGEYIKKDQQFISRQLRITDTVINEGIIKGKDLNKEGIKVIPRGEKQVHAGIAESTKDIWNEEIIKMVNWIYSINWYQITIQADKQINQLTDKLAGVTTGNEKK